MSDASAQSSTLSLRSVIEKRFGSAGRKCTLSSSNVAFDWFRTRDSTASSLSCSDTRLFVHTREREREIRLGELVVRTRAHLGISISRYQARTEMARTVCAIENGVSTMNL